MISNKPTPPHTHCDCVEELRHKMTKMEQDLKRVLRYCGLDEPTPEEVAEEVKARREAAEELSRLGIEIQGPPSTVNFQNNFAPGSTVGNHITGKNITITDL